MLLALAIVIALIGIVNTLMLSVFERTHEIGLLRAVGMRRRQVRAMIRSESVIIALFGAVVGVVIGTGLGVALASSLREQQRDRRSRSRSSSLIGVPGPVRVCSAWQQQAGRPAGPPDWMCWPRSRPNDGRADRESPRMGWFGTRRRQNPG